MRSMGKGYMIETSKPLHCNFTSIILPTTLNWIFDHRLPPNHDPFTKIGLVSGHANMITKSETYRGVNKNTAIRPYNSSYIHTRRRNVYTVSWWRHKMETFLRNWTFVWGIHRSPVNSPHKGQWRGALMFSLICAWTNSWANNGNASNLWCHRAHYDVIVMLYGMSTISHSPYTESNWIEIYPQNRKNVHDAKNRELSWYQLCRRCWHHGCRQ